MSNDFLFTEYREPPNLLLEEAYKSLGYRDGGLMDATDTPSSDNETTEWLEKGDWLTLAKKIGAEKVFFLKNDPVFVFCQVQDAQDIKALINTFRQAWCLARPQCLFMALPGELRVYSLNRSPAKTEGEWQKIKPLAVAYRVAEVAEKLQSFRREQVESGRLFAEKHFGNIEERADRRLIQDLRAVRKALLNADPHQRLNLRYAHALIGRSIFIRYLEDRGVLLPTYFEQVAENKPKWQRLLSETLEKPALTIDLEEKRYHQVLRDKGFTYGLFDRLAEHFNGDMFPRDPEEKEAVKQVHLNLLRRFLIGDNDSQQQSLFFWAYDFEIIPIELVSNIYEEFYHDVADNEDDNGTHYTPSVLAEYVLSQVLTEERLATNPRVLDPACGSGIFLVEAFRRIVRYKVKQCQGQKLSPDELRQIIQDQLTGIEINEEAAHVAAFSLYLALLHYQEPKDILAHKRLPHLIYVDGQPKDENHYHVLFNTDAFSLTSSERAELEELLASKKSFAGRADVQKLVATGQSLEIERSSCDVVIGNPPWDEVGSESDQSTDPPEMSSSEYSRAVLWAKAHKLPVGERSYSQLFIYRALSLVKENGIIGLLTHSSVIFNQRHTSQEFRQKWLGSSIIYQVVNFVRVRRLFFGKAIAPFIFVSFSPRQSRLADNSFVYLSARLTRMAEQLRNVILTSADRRIVRQSEVQNKDYLWKTYWWGNHLDAALLAALDLEPRLRDILKGEEPEPGYGFQLGNTTPSRTLRSLKPLKSKNLRWYGPLKEEWFETPPTGVKRQPDERLYQGQRLLVVEGAKADYGICARLEYASFSFRHTIYCVPLPSTPEWQAKLILGIFWSSLGRYRLFMTSGNWGTWYDKFVSGDILYMPIKLTKRSDPAVKQIVKAVDAIRSYDPKEGSLLERLGSSEMFLPRELLERLDEAIFDLYGLSEAERDLVHDFIKYKFDLFGKGANSATLNRVITFIDKAQGTISDIASQRESEDELFNYIYIFLKIWNRELGSAGEFRWRVIRPSDTKMLAVVFTTQDKDASLPTMSYNDDDEWEAILTRCEEALLQPISRSIYFDGIVRAVTDTDIFIIKRDERWLWTRSMAREDAEATILQAIHLQENN